MKLSIVDFFKAGAHFGHKTRYWNPKMSPYIFGARQGIHVIDLEQTISAMAEALDHVGNLVYNGGRVIFVGTKWVSRDKVAEIATLSDMPYVNFRWPGGMLTNFKTMKHSIKRLIQLEEQLAAEDQATFTKKERLQFEREIRRLDQSFGGIKKMNALPDAVIVMDVGHEQIAVQEANKLGIPVIGIVDSNNSPDGVDFVIPGNDDSHAAVKLYLSLFQEVIAEAKSRRPQESVVKKKEPAKDGKDQVKIVRKSKPADSGVETKTDSAAAEKLAEPKKIPAKKVSTTKAAVEKTVASDKKVASTTKTASAKKVASVKKVASAKKSASTKKATAAKKTSATKKVDK